MYKNLLALLLFLFHSFTIFSQSICPVFPKNNFVTNKNSITFSWNIINTTDTFNFQISNSKNFSNLLIDTIIIGNTFTIDTFFTTTTYFWKVKRTDATHYDTTISFTIFSPNSISSIALWLDADTGIVFESGKVKEWHDLSPNNNNLYQNNTSLQPLWTDSLINNKPCVTFTNTLDYFDFTDSIETVGITIYAIVQNKEQIYGSYILGKSNISAVGLFINLNSSSFKVKNNRTVNLNHSDYSDFVFLKARYDTNQYGDYWQSYYAKLQINQEVSDSVSMYGYPFVCDRLGYAYWYGTYKKFNGELAEIIIYSSPLNDSLNFLNEQYLRWKYAPPVNLGHDIYIPYGFCDTVLDAGSRFTSFLWSTGDTTQTISVNTTGYYSVTVTDIFGFQSSDEIFVKFPEPTYSFRDTTICLYDTITWYLNFDTSLHNFIWQDSSVNNFINIYQQGEYFCKIIDTNECFIYTDTIFVQIDSFPSSNLFHNEDTTLCIGTNLFCENSSALSFLWNTNDTLEYITLQDSGLYYLLATDSLGCTAIDSIFAHTNGIAPLIDFQWANHCLNDTTYFLNLSQTLDTSLFTSFIWTSPGLFSDTVENTYFIFPDTGFYNITLEGYTSANCFNKITKQIRIHPTPKIIWNQMHICQNQHTIINPTIISNTPIQSYFWSINDSLYLTSFPLEYNFFTTGPQNISLTVTDTNQCKNYSDTMYHVFSTPTAGFYTNGFCTNTPTIFVDTSVTSQFNPIISYFWDFGNSNSSTERFPQHVFSQADTFTVTLAIKGVNGCSDTTSQIVIINQAPEIHILPDTFCQNIPQELQIHSLNTTDITNVNWYIDSSTYFYSQDTSLQVIFDLSGTYQITAIVEASNGCTDTTNTPIEVLPQPNANFSLIDGQYIIENSLIHAIAHDSSNVEYHWYYYNEDNYLTEFENCENDFFCSSIIYANQGYNALTLVVEDSNGCYDTATTQFIIIPSPYYQYDEIKIVSFDYTIENNYIHSYVSLYNSAIYPVANYKLQYEVFGNGKILVSPQTVIQPNDTITYTLPEIQKKSKDIFICVSIIYPLSLFPETQYEKTCKNNNINSLKLINLYPNPANDKLFIDILSPTKNTITTTITNITGEQLKSYKTFSVNKGLNNITIDIKALSPGIYILKLNTEKEQIIRKIIKK